MTKQQIAQLEADGFTVETVPFSKSAHISCTSCQAVCINGTPCHENGCPNKLHWHNCYECGFAYGSKSRVRGYCPDCIEAASANTLLDCEDEE